MKYFCMYILSKDMSKRPQLHNTFLLHITSNFYISWIYSTHARLIYNFRKSWHAMTTDASMHHLFFLCLNNITFQHHQILYCLAVWISYDNFPLSVTYIFFVIIVTFGTYVNHIFLFMLATEPLHYCFTKNYKFKQRSGCFDKITRSSNAWTMEYP